MANKIKTTLEVDSNVQGAIEGFNKIQKSVSKLNLGKVFDTKLADSIARLTKNGQKMTESITNGFKKTTDLTKFNSGLNSADTVISSIVRQIKSIDPNKALISSPKLDELNNKLKVLDQQMQKISKDVQTGQSFKAFESFLTSVDTKKHSTKALTDFFNAFKNGKVEDIERQMKNLEVVFSSVSKRTKSGSESMIFWTQAMDLARALTKDYTTNGLDVVIERDSVLSQVELEKAKVLEQNRELINDLINETDAWAESTRKVMEEESKLGEKQTDLNKTLDHFKQRAQYFLGMENGVRIFRRAVRSAFNDVKELDKAMTATAVVTNFSVGDMWSQLPEYTQRANKLGASIKDVYEASTLFYQQGLKTNQVVALSTEALKMARIAGLDAATATDRMTNALRGFNMEINEANAQRINDVYSALAARTASNVDEISTAMTKVASLANNANMSFEKTSAFLAQIIETTRESAETAGTALKTVAARFSEVKELYGKGQLLGTDEEGEEIHVNRVSKALQTAGINLNEYFTGMKGLDDIFMDLASKWDKLDEVQQRYIATMAAGSRQQSRFIAMMQDYKRTLELVDIAENAAGASNKQFEKTLDSLDAKLNTLKNSWTTFTTGIANQSAIKNIVDFLRGALDIINKITGKLPGLLKIVANTGLLFGGLHLSRKLFDGLFVNAGKLLRGEAVKHATIYGGSFTKALEKIKMFPSALKNKFVASQKIVLGDYNKQMAQLIATTKMYNLTGEERTRVETQLNNLTAARRNILTSSLPKEYQAVALSAAMTDEEIAEALATKKLTKEELQELLAKKGIVRAGEGGIFTSMKLTLAKWGEAAASKSATFEKIKETAAQHGLNGAMTAGIAVAGLYLIAILAVVAALVTIVQIWKGGERIAQRWNNMAADQSAAISELSDKYEDLKGKIDELKDSYSTIDGMTVGTEAWKEKVKELNTQVDDLIDKYPQFAKYFESKNGVMELKEGAEAAFDNELAIIDKQTDFLRAGTPMVNAMAEYAQVLKKGTQKAVWAGVGTGAASLINPGLGVAIGSASTKSINNYIDKEYDKIREELEGNFSLAFAEGVDRDLANLLINNDSAVKQTLDAMTWTNQTNIFGGRKKFKNWDRKTQREYEQFQKEMYSGGRIGEGGGIYDANDNIVKNAEAIFAIWKVQKDYQKNVIDKAKIDRQNNPFIDRLLSGTITEMDYQQYLRSEDSLNQLGDIYLDVARTMRNQMITLGSSLYDAGFSSDTINSMNLELRNKIGNVLNSVPKQFKTEFIQIYEDFWSTLDEGVKEDVLKAIQSTDFTDVARINSLREELINILGENSDIDNFITGLEEVGIATRALTDSATELIKSLNVVKEAVKNSKRTIDQEGYDSITSDKVKKMFLRTGENEYTLIEDVRTAEAAETDAQIEALRQQDIAVRNSQKNVAAQEQKAKEDYAKVMTWQRTYVKDLSQADMLGYIQSSSGTYSNLSKKSFEQQQVLARNLYFWTNYGSAMRAAEDAGNMDLYRQIWSDAQKDMGQNEAQFAWSTTYQQNKLAEVWEAEASIQSQIRATQPKGPDRAIVEAAQTKYENDLASFKQSVTDIFSSDDYDTIEALINADFFQALLQSGQHNEWLDPILQGVISRNPQLFGLSSSLGTQGIGGSQAANLLEDVGRQGQIKETLDSLDKVSYFLKQGKISDYQAVYAETARLMSEVFGTNADANWINEHNELLIDLLSNTEDYELVLEEFREELLKNSPFDINSILKDTEFNEWGQAIINTSTIKDINAFAQTLEEAGYAVTILADGNIQLKDSFKSLLQSNFLSSKNGSGSGSGDDAWENPYDRLHNLLEHITAMQKSRNYLERQYTKELRNQEGSIQKTTELMTKRLENLQGERELQAKLAEERQKDLDNYYRAHADEVGGYAYYQNGRVYIDWDAIERDKGTMSKEEGKNLEDVINKLKGYTDSRDDATDKLDEIDQEIYDTHQTIIENYRNFEDRVLAAITADEQKRIDMMSKIDDSINDATDKLFDQAQKQIDEYRQTRENEKTESEIADKEARLAYLRRDTSGANALEIKKLEEELGDARQDYADSRIDQALEEMRNEADLAAEQRAEQIAIEQGILDYQKEMGYFWPMVSNLINSAFNSDGTVNWNSQLIDLLKETEGFKGLSELGKSEWIKQTNSAMLNLLDEETLRRILYGSDPSRTVLDKEDVAGGVSSGENQYGAAKDSSLQAFATKTEYQNEMQTLNTFIAGFKEVGEGIYGTDIPNKVKYYVQQYSTVFNQAEGMLSALSNSNFYGKDRIIRELKAQMNQWVDEYNNYLRLLGWDFAAKEHYAAGGLADFTGPAWLDGTHSNPEYVLNAAQTEGFLQLVDMFTKPQDAFSGTPGFGDNYFDIDINAEIGSDYDVDQLVEHIKTKITEDSMYRNVNAINFIR